MGLSKPSIVNVTGSEETFCFASDEMQQNIIDFNGEINIIASNGYDTTYSLNKYIMKKSGFIKIKIRALCVVPPTTVVAYHYFGLLLKPLSGATNSVVNTESLSPSKIQIVPQLSMMEQLHSIAKSSLDFCYSELFRVMTATSTTVSINKIYESNIILAIKKGDVLDLSLSSYGGGEFGAPVTLKQVKIDVCYSVE